MGGGRWTSEDWSSYSAAHVAGRSASAIFTSRGLRDDLDPAKFDRREARDSADNPASTPLILAGDVTGSMGMIAHELMKKDLNRIAQETYDRRPILDPAIAVMAIGDSTCDAAPIQMTQFESSIVLADQVKGIFVEGGGGGNEGESYSLAHLAAALKTATDSFEKRRRKGYLFTIGDEPILARTSAADVRRFLGASLQDDLTAQDCVDLARRTWEVFHVVIKEGHGWRMGADRVRSTWEAVLPQRVLYLDDHTKLGETVVSAMQVIEGARHEDVAASWGDRSTALTVAAAIGSLARRTGAGGIRRL